jgi:hypothetical protein
MNGFQPQKFGAVVWVPEDVRREHTQGSYIEAEDSHRGEQCAAMAAKKIGHHAPPR